MSLIELLVVLAVMLILIALGSGSFVGSAGTRNFSNALVSISGLMEFARQTAISENTHTYVAFTSPSTPNDPDDPLRAVVLVSVNGVDVRGAGIVEPPDGENSGAWKAISRISSLPNLILQTEQPSGNAIAAPPLPGSQLDSWFPFRLNSENTQTPSGRELVFDRVVKFTPRGIGYVESSLRARFGLWAVPSRNTDPSDTERQQAALILISGLTGTIQVIQPGEDAQ